MTKMLKRVLLLSIVSVPAVANAATLTWDPSKTLGATPGGNGTWNTTGSNNVWYDGTANVGWTNGQDALFSYAGVTTQAVTIGSAVTVGNITGSSSAADITFSGTNILTLANGSTIDTAGMATKWIRVDIALGVSTPANATITKASAGTFNASSGSNGARSVVWTPGAGSTFSITGGTVRGTKDDIGTFATIKMASGTTFFQERNSGGSALFPSAWELTGNATFDRNQSNNNGAYTLSGTITGTGKLRVNVGGGGTGNVLTLSNPNNSYSGGQQVLDDSILRIDSAGILGPGDTTIDTAGGEVNFRSTVANYTHPGNFSGVAGSVGIVSLTSNTTANLSGNITDLRLNVAGATTVSSVSGTLTNVPIAVTPTGTTGAKLTLSGKVTGTSSLAINGASDVVTLSGSAANDYTGATTVSAGKLIVNNNSSAAAGPWTVSAGATLGGSGSVPSVNVAGSIEPGNSIGTLTTGSIAISGTYTCEVDLLASQQADLIDVTGTVGVGGTLAVVGTNLPASPIGSPFEVVIIRNDLADAVAGTFGTISGFASTPNYAASVTYTGGDGNDVALVFTPVPEPTTLAALAGFGLTLLGRRRLSC